MVGETVCSGVEVCEEEGWPEEQRLYVLDEQSMSLSGNACVEVQEWSRRSGVA